MYELKKTPEDFIVEELTNVEFKDVGRYSYYLLEKKEYNSEKIIQEISKKYDIPRNRFGYAGNKDKQAITKQYFSLLGTIPESTKDFYSVKLVGRGDKPISLGDLVGNKFIITVRNIEKKPELIQNVINYFGEQRFSRNNFEAGISILKGDFKKASGLMEHNSVKEHLTKKPNDHVGAIKTVPYKILTIYINSVQSLLWNEVAAEYIRKKSKNIFEVNYSMGKYVFSNSLVENIDIPLICLDTEFSDPIIEGLYDETMKKYSLTSRNFIVRSIPNLSPMGNMRNLISEVKDMTVSELLEDELNSGKKKVVLEFFLGKGSYATVVIKKIMKN